MNWRATAVAFATTSTVLAGETNWTYARLIDAPLAPVERSKPVKILKLVVDTGPAADGEVQYPVAPISEETAKPGKVVETSQEKLARITPDTTVDPVSKTALNTWRVFVGGEVVRPGAFNAQRPFTALQAVVAAGGLKEGGKSTEILVLRYREKDALPTSKHVDLSASLAGKGASDLWLETHDVVIVPKAGSPTSTEEIIRGLPIPIATAAKSRLVEVHRVRADAAEVSKTQSLVLPAR
jgi:hypothetical protein